MRVCVCVCVSASVFVCLCLCLCVHVYVHVFVPVLFMYKKLIGIISSNLDFAVNFQPFYTFFLSQPKI